MTENPQDPGYLPPAPEGSPDPGTPVYQETVEAVQQDPAHVQQMDSLPTTGPDQPNN